MIDQESILKDKANRKPSYALVFVSTLKTLDCFTEMPTTGQAAIAGLVVFGTFTSLAAKIGT